MILSRHAPGIWNQEKCFLVMISSKLLRPWRFPEKLLWISELAQQQHFYYTRSGIRSGSMAKNRAGAGHSGRHVVSSSRALSTSKYKLKATNKVINNVFNASGARQGQRSLAPSGYPNSIMFKSYYPSRGGYLHRSKSFLGARGRIPSYPPRQAHGPRPPLQY